MLPISQILPYGWSLIYSIIHRKRNDKSGFLSFFLTYTSLEGLLTWFILRRQEVPVYPLVVEFSVFPAHLFNT